MDEFDKFHDDIKNFIYIPKTGLLHCLSDDFFMDTVRVETSGPKTMYHDTVDFKCSHLIYVL